MMEIEAPDYTPKRKREIQIAAKGVPPVEDESPGPLKRFRRSNSGALLKCSGGDQENVALDPDSFLYILNALPLQDVLSARLVCTLWNDFASSNPVWKSLFNSSFGIPIAKFTEQEEEEGAEANDDRKWFNTFVQVANRFPRFVDVRDSRLHKACKKAVKSEAEDAEQPLKKLNFHFFDLRCPPSQVDKGVHKLACILSLMHCNRFTPSFYDYVRVGYRSGATKLIPLSQFAYNILIGNESGIFPLRDNDCDDMPLTECNGEYPRDEGDDDEDGNGECSGPRVSRAVGVGPCTFGAFEPFVHYRAMQGQHKKHMKFEPVLEDKEENTSIFGPDEGIISVYNWETDERGWAPIFFNASFSWFHFAALTSAYNKETRRIVITQAKRKEMVW